MRISINAKHYARYKKYHEQLIVTAIKLKIDLAWQHLEHKAGILEIISYT